MRLRALPCFEAGVKIKPDAIAGIALVSPASANPSLQAYHLYTGQPSNWTCGATVTVDTVGVYARTCIVLASDGASYQDVTIVNNTAGSPQQINTESISSDNGTQDPNDGSCVGFGNNSTDYPQRSRNRPMAVTRPFYRMAQ